MAVKPFKAPSFSNITLNHVTDRAELYLSSGNALQDFDTLFQIKVRIAKPDNIKLYQDIALYLLKLFEDSGYEQKNKPGRVRPHQAFRGV
jgi:hypothetical protein